MPRADAQANRARILDAAMATLQDSPSASLTVIAKRAGVGIGTLYRHFPSREDLLVAVYRNELDHLVSSADELLTSTQPLEALRAWFDRLAYYGRQKVGLAEVLSSLAAHDRLTQESYEPIVGALRSLLAANGAAGTIRPDLDADDVLLMLGFLWRLPADRKGQATARRLLDLLLDGLRAG